MDAEDGLDLDPYSPVSNSNTEEMEELLRVEEEILNSPPKAEPAPKADKGDKVRLSGAARKRLAHYLAKGVPLEQARVLAKQPMPTAERGKKAGGSLKRERSANTTPEMSLPKRGSAKPGAGATPAKVPETEAGSTNRKAAQPPIPKPTEATGTREHRSYSEVASSDRFAVIAKGYPTALLSTKELVMVGFSYHVNQETANWLKATVPKLKLWNGAQIEIAEADMPRPQIYVGYFPKTEKCSNEDILQLLEGQNSALRIGDWRTLNRVERGKHVELTLSVDPVSVDLLKSQGYTLCYGFGLVNVRPKNRHSVGVKDTAAEPEPGTASTTQVQEASQELPCCSNSIAPSSNTPVEEKEKAGGSTLEDLMTSAKAAKMERPATKAPQVARMRPPLHGRLPNKPGKGARRSQEETVLLGSNRVQTEDLVAVWAKVPTASGEQEAVLPQLTFQGIQAMLHPERLVPSWNIARTNESVGSLAVTRMPTTQSGEDRCKQKGMEELEYETNEVHRNIENAFKESCIHKHRNSQRDVPWWNKLLEKLQKEACLGALRLQGVANLKSGDLTGHLKILEIFFSSPIVHLSDVQLPRMVFKGISLLRSLTETPGETRISAHHQEPKSGTQMAPNLKMETQELGYGGHASVGQ
ncbi:hypothetical protein ACLKA6_016985 [Drosophila palustris]